MLFRSQLAGTTHEIQVRKGDNLNDIAKEFCAKNKLGKDIEEKIVVYIKSNLPKQQPEKVKNTQSKRPNRFQEENSNPLETCIKNTFKNGSKYAGMKLIHNRSKTR